MDLRHERKRGNHVIGILILLALLCAAFIAAVLFSHSAAVPVASVGGDFSGVEDIDPRAAAASKSVFSFFSKPNAADEFSYEIKEKLEFDSPSAKCLLKLKNPEQNSYLMVLELVLDDTGEVLLRTGYLCPGQMIERAALDEALSAGEYAATANICAVAPDTYELLGILEQPVKVIIKA